MATQSTASEKKTISAKEDNQYFYGVGRRKSSSARAKYFPGSENLAVFVNKKPINRYFPDFYSRTIENAIKNIGVSSGTIHFFINGGGVSGQAEAARLAMAKALLKWDEGLKTILRMYGYLTTDIRKVQAKRPGFRKARKKEQWSKR